jgi:hypothetical protein
MVLACARPVPRSRPAACPRSLQRNISASAHFNHARRIGAAFQDAPTASASTVAFSGIGTGSRYRIGFDGSPVPANAGVAADLRNTPLKRRTELAVKVSAKSQHVPRCEQRERVAPSSANLTFANLHSDLRSASEDRPRDRPPAHPPDHPTTLPPSRRPPPALPPSRHGARPMVRNVPVSRHLHYLRRKGSAAVYFAAYRPRCRVIRSCFRPSPEEALLLLARTRATPKGRPNRATTCPLSSLFKLCPLGISH